jgi:hypothetical protein
MNPRLLVLVLVVVLGFAGSFEDENENEEEDEWASGCKLAPTPTLGEREDRRRRLGEPEAQVGSRDGLRGSPPRAEHYLHLSAREGESRRDSILQPKRYPHLGLRFRPIPKGLPLSAQGWTARGERGGRSYPGKGARSTHQP